MLAAAALGGDNPAIALGSRVIDLTPGAVKDWAIRNLGTNDKPVLLVSVFAVMVLLSAVAGLLAFRSPPLGLAVAALLNLVAIGAAVKTPVGVQLTAATLGPGLVSLVVSLFALWFFTRAWTARHAQADAPQGFDRRTFLAAALASGAVAAVGGGSSRVFGAAGEASRARVRLPAAASKATPVPSGAQLGVRGITPYLTPTRSFYRVDTALSLPQVDARSWRLRIHGMVEKALELTFDDILAMPLVERRITLTCVSNEVGGSYVGNATWLGVRTKDLLAKVGVRAGADAVKSTSVDAMTIGTPISALTDGRDAMLAIGMNGVPLPIKHGFPARMVVPGLYGYVSATKWVTDLEVTRFSDFTGYWTRKGWAKQAPIHTESRIDVPRQFGSVTAGKVPVAGVAWAQHTGVRRVEVRVDGGPWREANLAKQDTTDTWRQWVYPWDATSGQHKLEVRATDASGYTQTPRRASPRPDGATGWHSVTVDVA
ncbi:MAG: molybdopterin-dependent oxidoreductase [Actinomycetota bacterium]|nr:molybdopterin-dependent oxidoreductase [Actinomycetota bacterium]